MVVCGMEEVGRVKVCKDGGEGGVGGAWSHCQSPWR